MHDKFVYLCGEDLGRSATDFRNLSDTTRTVDSTIFKIVRVNIPVKDAAVNRVIRLNTYVDDALIDLDRLKLIFFRIYNHVQN